eukprot:3447003-Prymnesium_polylepis.1
MLMRRMAERLIVLAKRGEDNPCGERERLGSPLAACMREWDASCCTGLTGHCAPPYGIYSGHGL